MREDLILKGFEYAREAYAALGVDAEAAMKRADGIPISMNCWQGDDIRGCEDDNGGASGGIATTGNYPGRARGAEELRGDISEALKLIPGTTKLNLHANYAELNGKKLDRDAYTREQFENWIGFAKEKGIGLDFNPTYFSHPYAAAGFTLASTDKKIRDFWIEHGKRCREIARDFGRELGKPCVVNFWMPDGYKDTPADTAAPRARLIEALDEIFADKSIGAPEEYDAVESKLFGLGVESYTVGSHETMMGYALTRQKLYTLDAGHFHPLEYISDKISSVMQYMPQMLLHVSRGVRWDSDHVITLDDELQRIMNEIIYNGYDERVFIALDYFDASINRVAAWVIGVRNARKALLRACLTPEKAIREAEYRGDFTSRLALQEENKTLPFQAIWDMYCLKAGAGAGQDWLSELKRYEKDVQSKR